VKEKVGTGTRGTLLFQYIRKYNFFQKYSRKANGTREILDKGSLSQIKALTCG
jgi:hypothetical protein